MNLEGYAMAAFVIIGLVNGVQMAVERKWQSFSLFMTAVVGAGIFGYLHWFGLPSLEVGLALGISSSGIYKTAQKAGGN